MLVVAHRLPIFVGVALFLAGAACSPAGGTRAADDAAAVGPCPEDNLTQQCTCAGVPGRQVCLAGGWGPCECATPSPAGTSGASGAGGGTGVAPTFDGNLRTDITFQWQSIEAPVLDGTCPPGQYEGNIQGIYYSALNPTPFGLPITNLELPGSPSGFHFELMPAQGGELTQKVKGEVNGLVDALFPFVAQIDGELNCRTGVFEGTLSAGHYSILAEGLLPQQFEGVAHGKYDKRTHTFVNGQWDVRETTSNPPGKLAPSLPRDLSRDGFGGSGDFAAALPTNPNDPALTACPSNLTCGPHLLGPNKMLCNNALGTPTCLSDADCASQFPGENVPCLKASLFSLCVRECKK